MRKSRWIQSSKSGGERAVIYHCISRVVDRRLVFKADEKEKLRTFMRMYENFTGCRVLSYCFMCNHIHLLLEVTPMPVGGFTDTELLGRLRAIYNEAQVAEVAKELAVARKMVAEAMGEEAVLVTPIHERFTRRMHDLSEFMKSFVQRYSQWHNRTHQRTGHLWEDRFKSLIVEDGAAARMMAAYIDLNPVRAGMVSDPADYRWSSYGEAVGGGRKGNGRKSREGLVRAWFCHDGVGFEAERWVEVSRLYRSLMGMTLGRKPGRAEMVSPRQAQRQATMNTAEILENEDNGTVLKDLGIAKMLRCRIRYFTEGAVIGSKDFVNEAFVSARERFGAKRKDGARVMRGNGSGAKGLLWSARDLRVDV